jgi:hypothetical protein
MQHNHFGTQDRSCKEALMSEDELRAIEARCNAATKGPWQSFIEGRDHVAGSDFIRTGGLDDQCPDIELSGATHADQDFIAHARQDVPALIAEIRRLTAQLASQRSGGT